MGKFDTIKKLFCTLNGLTKVKMVISFLVGALTIVTSVLTILGKLFDPLQVVRSAWNILFGTLMIFVQLKWTKWISKRFGFLNGWFGRGMFYLLYAAEAPCMHTPQNARAHTTRTTPSRSQPAHDLEQLLADPSQHIGRLSRGRSGEAQQMLRHRQDLTTYIMCCCGCSVGTNIITNGASGDIFVIFSWLAGIACMFVGTIELCLGFKCGDDENEAGEVSGAATEAAPAEPKSKKGFSNIFGSSGKTDPMPASGEPTFTVNVTPNQIAQGANFAANNAGDANMMSISG